MAEFELLEYRPGRWAKVDPVTGAFLGPASPQEVLAWRDERASPPKAKPSLAPVATSAAATLATWLPRGGGNEQPPAPDTPPPPPEPAGEAEPEEAAEPAPPPQAEAEKEAEPTTPQQPEAEKKGEPTPPQQPEPEKKAEPTPPQQPEPEKKAEPAPPQQPEPEKKAEPAPPQQPEPEKKAEPSPPSQPTPVKKKKPAPRIKGMGTGAAAGMQICWPLPKRYRITSNFMGHKSRRPPSRAPGIDLACPRRTNVYAWAAGRVIRSRWSAGGGRSLWIQHSRGFKTYYAHLNCLYVLEGETVKVGQKIGESGATGNATGPHLHFSVVRQGKYVDPERFLVLK